MDIKQPAAIFLDIDGTLLSNNEKNLSYNLEIIKRVRALGNKVYINTGRTLVFLPPQIKVEENFDGAVLGDGAHIILDGKTVHYEYIENNFLLESFKLINKRERWLVFEGDTKLIFSKMDNIPKIRNAEKVNTMEELKAALNGVHINKISLDGNLEDKSAIIKISDKIDILEMECYTEIINKGSGKDKGIEIVLKHIGINKENTVAVGDSMNDFKMLKYAGIGVAMENAEEGIKKVADVIAPSCEEGGVGQILEKIFL